MNRGFATLPEILEAYWPILLISFLASVAATPVCRWIALKKQWVDRPDDWLKPHEKAIPYLGGVAIFLGWSVGILWALVFFHREGAVTATCSPTLDPRMMGGILLAGLLITAVGLFDDLRLASPRMKLAAGMVVAVLLMAFGVGEDSFLLLVSSTGVESEGLSRGMVILYSVPITVFVILGACNATNLIDGLDGLCSGVLGIMSVGFLVLATHMHLWSEWHHLDAQRVTLSLAMLGAALGFLPFNRNPARIFMGDAGSMLLGLNVAILLLLFAESRGIRWMLGSLMIFGLPLSDMVLTLARRWRNQKPLMQGDRSHFYDQLVDRGWPVRRVVRISYAAAACFALMGCAAIVLRVRYLLPLYFTVGVCVLIVIRNLGMVRVEAWRGPRQSA